MGIIPWWAWAMDGQLQIDSCREIPHSLHPLLVASTCPTSGPIIPAALDTFAPAMWGPHAPHGLTSRRGRG